MIIKEYRIILPMSVEEYGVAQLWSVAEASKNETGGGEGIEVIKNEPFENDELGKGQYTHKIYHFQSRCPTFLKPFAPKGSLEFDEEAWNAYPYCKTVVTNPGYMKDDFELSIESWYKPDFGTTENVHKLPKKLWKDTEVIHIDIVNDPVSSSDYEESQDPMKFVPKAEGRGPLKRNWIQRLKSQENCATNDESKQPHMCAYKLVRCNFKWFGLQGLVENFIHKSERRIFLNFNRQVYCWMDKWHGLTMDDIRRIEDETKEDLEKMRSDGKVRGTKCED